MLLWITEGEGTALGPVTVEGARLCRAVLPGAGLLWRQRRGLLWRRIRRLGFRRAVMAPALCAEAAQYGVAPLSPAALRRALLPQLYEQCAVCTAPAAALRAPYADGAVYEAAAFLARRVRYLQLEIPRGAEALADFLRREYGLCDSGAGLAVCGGVSFSGPPRCAEVCLGEDGWLYQQAAYTLNGRPIPEELLAALWETGAVQPAEIRVTSVAGRA